MRAQKTIYKCVRSCLPKKKQLREREPENTLSLRSMRREPQWEKGNKTRCSEAIGIQSRTRCSQILKLQDTFAPVSDTPSTEYEFVLLTHPLDTKIHFAVRQTIAVCKLDFPTKPKIIQKKKTRKRAKWKIQKPIAVARKTKTKKLSKLEPQRNRKSSSEREKNTLLAAKVVKRIREIQTKI